VADDYGSLNGDLMGMQPENMALRTETGDILIIDG
jgi:hypothetical protein